MLEELIEGTGAVPQAPLPQVSGVNADSRAIGEGEAFFALPGQSVHGDAFASEAVRRGAVAVVTDRALQDDPGVPVVIVPDVRAA
jgi:UDP-N-acetylmuramoyl-L-alanyl-D-glutamate--2,6-diaminopimelate ligase